MMYMTIHMKSYECCVKMRQVECEYFGFTAPRPWPRPCRWGPQIPIPLDSHVWHLIHLASLILWQDWDKTVIVYLVYELVCEFVLYVHCMFDIVWYVSVSIYVLVWNKDRPIVHHTLSDLGNTERHGKVCRSSLHVTAGSFLGPEGLGYSWDVMLFFLLSFLLNRGIAQVLSYSQSLNCR